MVAVSFKSTYFRKQGSRSHGCCSKRDSPAFSFVSHLEKCCFTPSWGCRCVSAWSEIIALSELTDSHLVQSLPRDMPSLIAWVCKKGLPVCIRPWRSYFCPPHMEKKDSREVSSTLDISTSRADRKYVHCRHCLEIDQQGCKDVFLLLPHGLHLLAAWSQCFLGQAETCPYWSYDHMCTYQRAHF